MDLMHIDRSKIRISVCSGIAPSWIGLKDSGAKMDMVAMAAVGWSRHDGSTW